MQRYTKPSVTDLGTLRELTLLGADPDCDGGVVWGVADGSSTRCERVS